MLTVADILATDGLDLTLQAGAAAARIRCAGCIPASWTTDAGLRGGELLLTTGQLLQRDPAGHVCGWRSTGCRPGPGARLWVRRGAGGRAGRGGAALVPAVHDPLRGAVHRDQRGGLRGPVDARVQAIESLTHLVLDDRGLDGMLAEMARASGSALCLRDAGGRVLAADRRDPSPATRARSGCRWSPARRSRRELLAQPGERCDRQLLHHIRTVLAVELLKRRAVTEAEQRLAGDLVESVLVRRDRRTRAAAKAGRLRVRRAAPARASRSSGRHGPVRAPWPSCSKRSAGSGLRQHVMAASRC